MANKKRQVSAKELLLCHAYFQRAIQNHQFRADWQDAYRTHAIAEFFKLNIETVNEEAVAQLQTWIDAFVDAPTWKRCYRTLNQKKYLNKNKPKTLSIRGDAYDALKEYASQQNMSFSDAIIQLVETQNESSVPSANAEPVPTNASEVNPSSPALVFADRLNTASPERSSHGSSLVEGEELLSFDGETEFDMLWGGVPHWPRKPENYHFKHNESYKKYRNHLKQLTVKHPDETLLTFFNQTMNYSLTQNNCHQVGAQLLFIQREGLKHHLFSRQFNAECFAVSPSFFIANFSMEHYADELLLFLGLIFGCTTASITSGNRTPLVFAGAPNQVLMAYKAYQFLDAFLSKEVKWFEQSCHKNTKKTNRRTKAQWHGGHLVTEMFHSIVDDEETFKLMEDEQQDLLSHHVFKKVHVYYDENEPIGGWWTPDKDRFRW
ncbi:MAG: hypothetical protein LEGION0403_FIIPPAGN_02061 [Legionella sp.]|uniref:DUF7168 domain-containing protein n=1 Tax=Legionella sp. TaxID=459 RepID=UPI003D0C51B0